MEHRVQYLRDERGQNVGCIAIQVHHDVGELYWSLVEYQVSVVNPLDTFDRSVARQLALGRMVEAPFTVRVPINPTMYEISRAIMKDITRDSGMPSRARKAARLWLRRNATHSRDDR